MAYRRAMRVRVGALALASLLQVVDAAQALTQLEIDRGANRAQAGLRGVTRRLASDRFGGRDNDTPASLDTQAFLIKKLRRLGAGLGPGAGDAAYRQPFVQSGQTGTNLLAVIPGRDLPDEYVFIGA